MVKNLPAMWETRVQSLGGEDPLQKGMITHSSALAWRIPWKEKPGGYSPWGHNESDTAEQLTHAQNPYAQNPQRPILHHVAQTHWKLALKENLEISSPKICNRNSKGEILAKGAAYIHMEVDSDLKYSAVQVIFLYQSSP